MKELHEFLAFGTMFGHKTANSWNLLISFNSVQVILLACSIPLGWAYAFHQDKVSLVRVPVANVTLSSSAHFAIEKNTNQSIQTSGMRRFPLGLVFFGLSWHLHGKTACASRAALVKISNQFYGMIHGDGDNDTNDGDDDERVGNNKVHSNVVEEEDGEWICFLGGNNSSGTKKYRGSNSSDGGNTGDGVKIAGGVIGSGGEIESSEELKEMLPDEAGK
ncbi:hypothetical protein Tco_0536932 [Tanacetum coccineum]